MIPMTCAEVAAAVGGVLEGVDPSTLITSVSTQSGSIAPGDLFVAIRGERADGHDFAAAATRAGAVAVLAAHSVGCPAILVDDPVLALGRLAAHVRASLVDCLVVGITGSSGKTTTKDLIAQVLEADAPTVFAPGSFNSEVGLPMTMLQADDRARYLVLEMGMRGPGHIRYLCDIARPNVAVLLNVGRAHVGMLGSLDAIAVAKGEILEGLADGGTAILNGDDPLVMSQSDRVAARARVVTFGHGRDCDARAVDVRLDARGCGQFTLQWQDQAVPVALQLPGEHMIDNALAAAAVGLNAGLALDVVGSVLRSATARSPMRMELQETDHGVLVVNDAYNANPESVAAALRTVTSMAAGRRTWAVLGEMRELGSESALAHRDVGVLVAELGFAELLAVGDPAESIVAGAQSVRGWSGSARAVADPAAAATVLMSQWRAGDVILVKASRSIGLESIVQALLGHESRQDEA